ncbi:HTH-type transcriptional regulator, LysR family [Sulfitobacter noctilucae]|uniref:LysR substrate-binding domain-containing protein n=1 Tax=Sulfitobacter noctilucae TaxID=1342302 RepID=UPI000469EA42|nr:LysR substrate-binding domain-containing protein [Sulfitobacter noctilucae]KIN61131.1 HTH-type transcriptional regulator, LysR family [Sulfitobacter noctilucae]
MPLRFTFRQLEYLVAVGDAGTIALAAQRINVSSPSISAAISQLEAEFGTPLFVRHHAQGLTLTPGGQRIFNEAKRILHSAGALNDLASDIADLARGPIGVGSLITVAPLVSASVRRSFEAAFPDADVTLREGHQVDLLRMLGRAEIDVAITYDLEIPKDIVFEPLVSLPPYVMLPRDHPLAGRASLSLQDLAGAPMVLLDMPLSREYFLSMFQSAGIRPVIAERTSDMSVSRSLVANGFGFGLNNIHIKTTLAPDGEPLSCLPLNGDHRPMVLGLATKRAEHRPRIVAAFHDHVKELADAGALPGITGP